MAKRNVFTVAGATVAALVGFARSKGVELRDELERLDVDEKSLAHPDARVETTVNDRLWQLASERLNEPDLGLRFAEAFDVDGFHLVGHLALASRTIGEAIERIVEFSRLLHDAGRTELEAGARGDMLLFPGCRGLPVAPPRQVAEFNTAAAVVLIRSAAALPKWAPKRVEFLHAKPASTKRHRAVFGVEPTFGALEDCLVLTRETMALPVRASSSSQVQQYLEGYGKTLLAALVKRGDDEEDTLRSDVVRAIVTAIGQGAVPSLEPIAERLAMTPRTLQRRLANSGDSFARLVDEARREAAEHFLDDDKLPLAEISYLLGFQDPATFHKAFKRWTGSTPGAFRRQRASS